MWKRSYKRKHGYIYRARVKLQLTCLIHAPGHSSEKCKLLNDVGAKHSKGGAFTASRQEPTANKRFGNKQEVNAIFKKAVNKIILQENERENEKLNAKNETHKHENTDSEIDEK